MKLSIVTVNLNNKDGLQKTIDSLINQTCQDFEWIIIDGGSKDGSKQLIEKYTDYIDYWISEPDKGIYNAMNKGIIASHGDFLLFLNSGDCLFDERVVFNVLKTIQDKDIYIGKEKRSNKILDVDISNRFEILYSIGGSFFPHQSTFINRKLFLQYGLYNINRTIISDWEFFFNIILYGDPSIEKIPIIVSVYNSEGISSINIKPGIIDDERYIVISEKPYIKILIEFYVKYFKLIQGLRNNVMLKIIGKLYLKIMNFRINLK